MVTKHTWQTHSKIQVEAKKNKNQIYIKLEIKM